MMKELSLALLLAGVCSAVTAAPLGLPPVPIESDSNGGV